MAEQNRLRSRCPIAITLEILGDRWTLLIVRDLMLKGRHSFGALASGGERIASNILADRLARLEAHRIVAWRPDPADGRRKYYRLTERGIALAPLLYDMILWGAEYEDSAAPAEEVAAMKADRAAWLDAVEARWRAEASAGG